MDLYIPFIHKLLKKEKYRPTQIPLYIDNTPVIPEKLKEEAKESIFIIELF